MKTILEKARDLIDQYDDALEYSSPSRYAQECALIHLNGIIDFIWSIDGHEEEYYEYLEIKKEIEKIINT